MYTGDKYAYLNSEGAQTVSSRSGNLRRIVVGEASAQAVRVYDSAGSGGSQIAELKAGIAEGHYDFNCRFAKGLHIENPGGGKLTIIYN